MCVRAPLPRHGRPDQRTTSLPYKMADYKRTAVRLLTA
jgi:hypothetical protein